jgi:two-component system, chemotaxis family, chemotaxis protein CheV
MSMKLDAESYLKSGSNELRVLEYRTCGMSFGINILKVSKIVSNLEDFTSVPESHPSVKGMFKDMNRLVPVVDLADFLGIQCESKQLEKVIVTEFFGMQTGLWVHRIDWIHHFRWEQVIDAQDVFADINQRYVIGIVKPTEDHMVLLLDYETILLDLCPGLAEKNAAVAAGSHTGFQNKRILVAEDSPAVRLMLVDQITQQGGIVVEATDGKHAWEQFCKQPFDLVISDVEMPQVDGLALTLNIRQSDRPNTPVIVYSSIGDMGMKARAAYLKADAHITKLNSEELMRVAEKLMRGEKLENNGFEDVVMSEGTAAVAV